MFYHFATDLLWVVLLEAWGNVEQAAGRNWRKTPTHRKGMEKWSKVKSNTHREGPILGHSFYRQLKGAWEGTISQPLVGCLLLERIRMPALHRWLTTEHRGEEGGKEFPLGWYISDPVLLTANSGGGGTFGRKCPPLGSGGVRMVPRGRATLAPQSPSFLPLHPRGGDSTISPASSWVGAAEGGHEAGLQRGPFRLHSHPWALGSPEFPHSLRQEGRHGHLICPGRWLTTDKQQLLHPHWGHLPDCPPWNRADGGPISACQWGTHRASSRGPVTAVGAPCKTRFSRAAGRDRGKTKPERHQPTAVKHLTVLQYSAAYFFSHHSDHHPWRSQSRCVCVHFADE